MLNDITPFIITYNEEANLSRTLTALDWAKRVLVIDSGSTDRTLEICREFDNVDVIHHPFESFAQQCNFALTQDIRTDWVISMDADYVVSNELRNELDQLHPENEIGAIAGYEIAFEYCINGQALRGSLYPPRVSLYRWRNAEYWQDGHAHKVTVQGQICSLKGKIKHDDRKPMKRWLAAQSIYAKQEADKLRSAGWQQLSLADKCRRMGLAPLLIVPYTMIAKGLMLDGKAGWIYTKQRLTAECFLWREIFTSAA